MRKQSGFTVIELTMVIAIIGLISSIVLVSLGGARAKARDVRRIADLQEIRKALDLYYNKYEKYPPNTDSNDMKGGWDVGNANLPPGDTFIKPLEDEGLLKPMPVEQTLSEDDGTYRYFLYDPSVPACGKIFYILMAKLERPQESYGLDDAVDPCLSADPGGLPDIWRTIQSSDWYGIMAKE